MPLLPPGAYASPKAVRRAVALVTAPIRTPPPLGVVPPWLLGGSRPERTLLHLFAEAGGPGSGSDRKEGAGKPEVRLAGPAGQNREVSISPGAVLLDLVDAFCIYIDLFQGPLEGLPLTFIPLSVETEVHRSLHPLRENVSGDPAHLELIDLAQQVIEDAIRRAHHGRIDRNGRGF